MKNARLNIVCLAVLGALFSGGCAAVAIGAAGAGVGIGTYAYIKGELEVIYPSPYNETWTASLAALDKLGIQRRSAQKDAFSGLIEATRADRTRLKIRVTPITATSTSVKIRVGTFGDRTISQMISTEIDAGLKKRTKA